MANSKFVRFEAIMWTNSAVSFSAFLSGQAIAQISSQNSKHISIPSQTVEANATIPCVWKIMVDGIFVSILLLVSVSYQKLHPPSPGFFNSVQFLHPVKNAMPTSYSVISPDPSMPNCRSACFSFTDRCKLLHFHLQLPGNSCPSNQIFSLQRWFHWGSAGRLL